jgi:hypothetical protein
MARPYCSFHIVTIIAGSQNKKEPPYTIS